MRRRRGCRHRRGNGRSSSSRDPDGELAEGDILIDSELLLPPQPELGVGERTRRITTSHVGEKTQVEERTVRTQPPPAPRPLATLVYDDQSGRHSYDVTRDSIVIGRGSTTSPVDVKIESSVDVSREHARIRRDPASGQFFLIDLSTLGTTLNNRHVPRGYDEVDGVRRETGVETPLPDRRAHRSCRDRISRVLSGRTMRILLWARFALLASLVALVVLYIRAELLRHD